ncbi:ABC transporter substrate-binding protein [Dongia deserti]|uniref:ABC transporter substrate-binding protein n=1 Tax=Dongia deserti TaxID=2268030 RepID=UPI002546798E|nr:ABC transporter substrate-binding protein [Dongia deserti]
MKRITTWLLAGAMLAATFGSAIAEDMKKVKIGTEGAYPPFNSIDPNGKLVGFDIDIAKALCKAAKFDCEFVVQDWDGIIDGLNAKKYDAIIASMSITEERKKVVDFTKKYYNTPAKFVAKKDANLEISPEGLKGKAVGVQRATIHENFLRDNFPDVDIRTYATQDEANADLVAGRVDLVMADSVALLEGFLETPEGADFEFVGPNYSEPKWHGEGAGIAIRKGDTELLNALNKAIDQIRADGTYKAINDKYFDFDVYGKPVS